MEATVFDWVDHYALTRPDRVVFSLLETGETRTWRELDKRVGRLALALSQQYGIGRGDAISVLAENDIRFFELQFACIRLGALFAPLNFRLSADELDVQVAIVKPRVLFCDEGWGGAARELANRNGITDLVAWRGSGATSPYETMAGEGGMLGPRSDAREHDVVHVLFTSGTTGTPKGATTTLGAMNWQALNQVEFARVADDDAHVLSPLPLFHGGALHSLCNPVLRFGGRITICRRFDPVACAVALGDPAMGVTHISMVPVMYQSIADSAPFARIADLRHVKAMLVAGGAVSPELYAQYEGKGAFFSSQYGATETGPTVTALNPARKDKILAGSCGQKAFGVEIRLVAPDGNDVEPGEPGEILVRGPAVMNAYHAIERETGFVDGWFATGDVARIDDEGFLFVVGRTKEMYKSGGENVFPLEVEKVLETHPDIAEAAVLPIPDKRWGEVGLAYVVPRAGAMLSLEQVRTFCEGKLARYKHPAALRMIDSLPRGPMNKVAKAQLLKSHLSKKVEPGQREMP